MSSDGFFTKLKNIFLSSEDILNTSEKVEEETLKDDLCDTETEAKVVLSEEALSYVVDRDVEPIRPDIVQPIPPLASHENLSERPQISVVLGTLDRLKFLKLAIRSVRENLKDEIGEIIVIDGGSTDGTIAWLTKQKDIITILQHNRYTYRRKKMRRRSWGGFMNMGFRAAQGEYIAMISDDCYLLPNAIRNGIDRMEAADAEGLNTGACAFYFRNWPEQDKFYVQRTLGGNLMVNHGIYRRDALDAANYANEDDYVFYKADTDLSLNIWKAGYHIIDCPDSICEHYVGVEEMLRASNNAVMEYDRTQMRNFWPELTSKVAVSKMGKVWLETQPDFDTDKLWGRFYRAEERAQKKRK